jgi:CRP-like cAMP-binding protein
MDGMNGLVRTILNDRWDAPFVARLRHYTEFDKADIANLRALIEGELTVKKRRDLVVDGYEYRKLCFVRDGVAARYKLLRNGKRQIVSVVLPGDVVGLPGSFLDQASFSVIAVSDMKLEVCALEDFVALCRRRPKFSLALSWLAVHEATIYADRIVDIGRRTALERVAHFLLEIHARLAMVGRAPKSGFELSFSQEVMSDALGLSVPHLNRMLARLRTEGLIAIADRQVTFVDLKALQLLAHFQPSSLARIPTPHGRLQAANA